MVRVKIDFPEDIAEEKAAEAKEWKPGTPMKWEAEEYHTKEAMQKKNGNVLIKAKSIEIELSKEEVEQIKNL